MWPDNVLTALWYFFAAIPTLNEERAYLLAYLEKKYKS